jgi:hypothetical protein
VNRQIWDSRQVLVPLNGFRYGSGLARYACRVHCAAQAAHAVMTCLPVPVQFTGSGHSRGSFTHSISRLTALVRNLAAEASARSCSCHD